MSANPRLTRGVTVTRRQINEDEVYYLVREPQSGMPDFNAVVEVVPVR